MKKTAEEKTISVCPYCGTPLIFTFRWDYYEKFCLNCGRLGDCFWGEETKITPELEFKRKILDKIWKALYGKNRPLLPVSKAYRNVGCKKCENGELHPYHLTKTEKIKGRVAQKILKNLRGIFD